MLIPMGQLRADYGVEPREVLHVGAHLGEESADYLAAGVRKVWWVEANPALIPALAEAIGYTEGPRRRGAGQYVIHAAVGSPIESGEKAMLHLASNGESSSLLEPGTHLTEHPEVTFEGEVEVTLTTIDELVIEHFMSPDFLNLDIQGAELDALNGAADVALWGVRWVYLEVNERELYKGCPMVDDIDVFLDGYGFSREAMVMTRHGWGDALYVRRG